jgi:hypothetical protein
VAVEWPEGDWGRCSCRHATEVGKERKEKRKRAQELDALHSDSDDEFYDRTKKPAKPAKGDAAVLTVKTLCVKLQAQEKEAADLRVRLQACISITARFAWSKLCPLCFLNCPMKKSSALC